jgi:hypothetical protein
MSNLMILHCFFIKFTKIFTRLKKKNFFLRSCKYLSFFVYIFYLAKLLSYVTYFGICNCMQKSVPNHCLMTCILAFTIGMPFSSHFTVI